MVTKARTIVLQISASNCGKKAVTHTVKKTLRQQPQKKVFLTKKTPAQLLRGEKKYKEKENKKSYFFIQKNIKKLPPTEKTSLRFRWGNLMLNIDRLII